MARKQDGEHEPERISTTMTIPMSEDMKREIAEMARAVERKPGTKGRMLLRAAIKAEKASNSKGGK